MLLQLEDESECSVGERLDSDASTDDTCEGSPAEANAPKQHNVRFEASTNFTFSKPKQPYKDKGMDARKIDIKEIIEHTQLYHRPVIGGMCSSLPANLNRTSNKTCFQRRRAASTAQRGFGRR